MPAVTFVTCRTWPELSASDALAAAALERRGVRVIARPWNVPGPPAGDVDLVVLRSNWDYHCAPDAFLAWLDATERAGAPVWNPPALVRWNLTKRYLLELAARGLPAVPTVVLDDPAALPGVMAARGWAVAVVKPLVSASGHDTVRVTAGDAPAVARALVEGRLRGPAIVQPFVEAVPTRGEWSLVFLDGAFSHAALKRPAPGDFRVQAQYGGAARAAEPPAALVRDAARVLAALPAPPLYARVDGVESDDGLLVMELELNEPALFFTQVPAAAERFADAIAARL